MKPITSWHQLAGLMSNRTVSAYQRLYDSPEDLELFSAGIAEVPVAGGLLGPTFTCIIGRQYHNIRCHTTPSKPVRSQQPHCQERRQVLVREWRLAQQLHPRAAPGAVQCWRGQEGLVTGCHVSRRSAATRWRACCVTTRTGWTPCRCGPSCCPTTRSTPGCPATQASSPG